MSRRRSISVETERGARSRAALEAARHPPYAYRFERTHRSPATRRPLSGEMGSTERCTVVAPGAAASSRGARTARPRFAQPGGPARRGSSSTSARDDPRRRALRRCSTCSTWATGSASAGRCSAPAPARSPCASPTLRAPRQVAPAAAVGQGGDRGGAPRVTRRSPTWSRATASATPTWPCIPRCARSSGCARAWCAACARFLDDRGYLEVETPVLQPLYGGASARPFTTHHNALDMHALPAHRGRAVPQAADRRRARAGVRDRQGLPQRGHGPRCTIPSSPCSSSTQAFADYADMMELTERAAGHVVDETVRHVAVLERRRATMIDFTPPFRARQHARRASGRRWLDVPSAGDDEHARRPAVARRLRRRRRRPMGRRKAARRAVQGARGAAS